MEFWLFFPIFTKGIEAKLNELKSESDIFPQNEGKVGKSELTPLVKALTNCALVHHINRKKLLSQLMFRVFYCVVCSVHLQASVPKIWCQLGELLQT